MAGVCVCVCVCTGGLRKNGVGWLWGGGDDRTESLRARDETYTRRNADNRMARVFPSARVLLSGRPPRALSDRRRRRYPPDGQNPPTHDPNPSTRVPLYMYAAPIARRGVG